MQKQTGNTLIMVLIVLLLITIVGAIAVRSSILGLSLATSNQINNLMLQNNDAVMFEIKDTTKVDRNLNTNQMFGYFESSANAEDELAFCYRADQSRFFGLANASVVGSNKIGNEGFCRRNWFSSGRSAILTQVYLKKLSSDEDLLANMNLGSSAGATVTPGIAPRTMSATVISVLPAFVSSTNQQIEECFKKSPNKPKDNASYQTVEECFGALNIPYNVQTSQFIVSGEPKRAS